MSNQETIQSRIFIPSRSNHLTDEHCFQTFFSLRCTFDFHYGSSYRNIFQKDPSPVNKMGFLRRGGFEKSQFVIMGVVEIAVAL
jgi:hypothetical protein